MRSTLAIYLHKAAVSGLKLFRYTKKSQDYTWLFGSVIVVEFRLKQL